MLTAQKVINRTGSRYAASSVPDAGTRLVLYQMPVQNEVELIKTIENRIGISSE